MKSYIITAREIIEILQKRRQSVTFAESCTGGRIAAAFTAVSGSSTVFNGSVVSYANTIKSDWLGVRPQTLERYGAVSEACVDEMLTGILTMAQADCAIAVSGIAGPTGGTPDKPVGTVYIGIHTPHNRTIHHRIFSGDREAVQEQSVAFAIDELHRMLTE
jgi:nicotinamide-nucleotide amidase